MQSITAPIKAEFENLHKLAPETLKACITVFTKERNRYAAEGKEGMADLYNTVLIALCEQRDRLKKAWGETERMINPIESEEAEWEITKEDVIMDIEDLAEQGFVILSYDEGKQRYVIGKFEDEL